VDLHDFVRRGGDVLSDVVGADRELPMAAVDEHGEAYEAGAPELEDRVERGPDRAARVEDVVDQHDVAPV
jgi:hypothetical protein